MSNYYIENKVCVECGCTVWSEDPWYSHTAEIIHCSNMGCKNSKGAEVRKEMPEWVVDKETWAEKYGPFISNVHEEIEKRIKK